MQPGPQLDQYYRSDKGFGGIPSTTFAAHREGMGAFAELDHPRSESYYYYNESPHVPSLDPQQELFTHTYKPPTVSGLGAQQGMEQHVPALLGLAARESLQRWGRLPEASADLSQHSRPMVQHLVARGIINEPKMMGGPDNPYRKGDLATEAWAGANALSAMDDPVPAEQAAAGSRFTRSLLRRQRGRPTPDYRQTEFDLGGK